MNICRCGDDIGLGVLIEIHNVGIGEFMGYHYKRIKGNVEYL